MSNRLHNWWQKWLIAADEATSRARSMIHSASETSAQISPLELSALEPRILFSATPIDPSLAPEGGEAAMVAEVEMPSTEPESPSIETLAEDQPDAQVRELIIIDSAVPDIQQMLDDLSTSRSDAEVFVLDVTAMVSSRSPSF